MSHEDSKRSSMLKQTFSFNFFDIFWLLRHTHFSSHHWYCSRGRP